MSGTQYVTNPKDPELLSDSVAHDTESCMIDSDPLLVRRAARKSVRVRFREHRYSVRQKGHKNNSCFEKLASFLRWMSEHFRFYSSDARAQRSKKARIITQLIISFLEATMTYSCLSLAMWTYCGAPISETPNLDNRCVFEKDMWDLLNLGFATIVFAITYLLRWYRIKYNMLPLCDLVDTVKKNRNKIEEIRFRTLAQMMILEDPQENAEQALHIILGEIQNDLRTAQTIIETFDLHNPPVTHIPSYNRGMQYLHLLLHAMIFFTYGAGVYFFCRLTVTFLSEKPHWHIEPKDWLWSSVFGAIQMLSVRTFIDIIEQRALQKYAMEMKRLGRAIASLYQEVFLRIAIRALFVLKDSPDIYKKEYQEKIIAVLSKAHGSLTVRAQWFDWSLFCDLNLGNRPQISTEENPVKNLALNFFKYMASNCEKLRHNGAGDVFALSQEEDMDDFSFA